jgi:hypothetical protein
MITPPIICFGKSYNNGPVHKVPKATFAEYIPFSSYPDALFYSRTMSILVEENNSHPNQMAGTKIMTF